MQYLLEKLGFALYMHAQKAAEAGKAYEAVEYLEDKEVLDD